MADGKQSKGLFIATGILLVIGAFIYMRLHSLDTSPPRSKTASSDSAQAPGPLQKYGSVEDLMRDPGKTFARLKGEGYDKNYLKELFAGYYACVAFQKGSDSACGKVDGWGVSDEYSPCRTKYYAGLVIQKAVGGKDAMSACVELGKASGEYGSKAKEACAKAVPLIRARDVKSLCSFLKSADAERILGGEGKYCGSEMGFLSGDEKGCEGLPTEGGRADCADRAKLVRAVVEKNPELAAETIYAPLVGKGPRYCGEYAKKVLEIYGSYVEYVPLEEQLREDAERAKRLEEEARKAREDDERQREAQARIEEEAAEQALKLKLEDELKKKEEGQRMIKESRAKSKLEETLKFNQARMEDERRKQKLGIPLEEPSEEEQSRINQAQENQ